MSSVSVPLRSNSLISDPSVIAHNVVWDASCLLLRQHRRRIDPGVLRCGEPGGNASVLAGFYKL
jgi:hypothetical protein